MKIKKLFLTQVVLLALILTGCNGGSTTTSGSSINSNNELISTSTNINNGLLITNASSLDINWANNSLENIPVGSKGIKAIKVTNITNQPFNKLTLETSFNMPQTITIDNERTTCSMGVPLAANSSCLYVFDYIPVGAYEAGIFTATVFAEQANNNATDKIDINYSTRVSTNAGTLAINVDTSTLKCAITSCNGTLYVVNSKGDRVSSIININGNDGTIFGTQLVNLNPSDSYTIQASPINGSIPIYSPNQTVGLVADKTITVNIKYPDAPVNLGKAIITLPKILPAYTGTLKVQILNIKNGNQVVDTEDLKQGDTVVVDLPVSDDFHNYVVKLANGIADPANGLFYDQQSAESLDIKDSTSSILSLSMEKTTSLSFISMKVSGLQLIGERKDNSVFDTATVSFSDANNYYKYVTQNGVTNGYSTYKVKTGLNFSIQVKANGSNDYKVNPIINTFIVDNTRTMSVDFEDDFAIESLIYVNRFNSVNAIGQVSFTNNGQYMYSATIGGTTVNQYYVEADGSIHYSGAYSYRNKNDINNNVDSVVTSPDGMLYIKGSYGMYRFNISSNGSLNSLTPFYYLEDMPFISITSSPVNSMVFLAGTEGIRAYNSNFDLKYDNSYYDIEMRPLGMAINSRWNMLYTVGGIPAVGGRDVGSQISAYNVSSNGQISHAYFSVKVDIAVKQIVIAPNGRTLYISDGSTVEMYHVSNYNGMPIYIRSYNFPGNIAISPNGKYFYTVDSSLINQYAITN